LANGIGAFPLNSPIQLPKRLASNFVIGKVNKKGAFDRYEGIKRYLGLLVQLQPFWSDCVASPLLIDENVRKSEKEEPLIGNGSREVSATGWNCSK